MTAVVVSMVSIRIDAKAQTQAELGKATKKCPQCLTKALGVESKQK
jgi:hypothetical protein